MKATSFAFACLAPLFVIGCKSDDDKLVDHWEELGTIVETNMDDCAKMGDALEAFEKKNGDSMRELMAKVRAKSDGVPNEKNAPRMKAALMKVLPWGQCRSNAKVLAAMAAIKQQP